MTDIDLKELELKADDFRFDDGHSDLNEMERHHAAWYANRKLRERLKLMPVVYSTKENYDWHIGKPHLASTGECIATTRAILCCVEKIREGER